MTGHYKAKCEVGKLYGCKQCGKMPQVGDERYYEKIGDNWIGCTDFECFKQQGGSLEPAQKKGGGKFVSSKFTLDRAIEVYQKAEELTLLYKETRKGKESEVPFDEATMVMSFFKTIAGSFKE